MLIKRKLPRPLGLNDPLRHADHRQPVSRRDFLSAGMVGGSATVLLPGVLASVLGSPAHAEVIANLDAAGLQASQCGISAGAGKIPFICFDLSGGANIAGSNVLVGREGGQMDFLTTAGYAKLGLPGDMTPNLPTFTDTSFGLAFHTDSAFLRGMQMRAVAPATRRGHQRNGDRGAFRERHRQQSAQSDVRRIQAHGADGQLLTLIGSQSSDSGGNSMAPGRDDRPRRAPDQGGPRQRRHRPGRHG